MRKISLRYGAAFALAALFLGGNGPVAAHDGDKHGPQNVANASTDKSAEEKLAFNSQSTNKSRAEKHEGKRRKSRTRWGANYFPNVPLTSHEGKQVHFFDDLIKDKVVMINFIYTTCKEVCSVETARLANVQQILGDRVGKDIFMYSITIDPENDTPEVLKKYRERFDVKPGWSFYTGKESDIVLLRRKLGIYIEGVGQSGPNANHNVSLIIGNQTTGKWMKRSPFDDPYFLANQVGSWLSNWERPDSANQNSYADAPKLRMTTMGENIYRTRCSSCHTFGGTGFANKNERRLGPDLAGVSGRRDKDWLKRWIANPEKMLAEKDPTAMEIVEQYNNATMPNLQLSSQEVEAMIAFMEEEDRHLEQIEKTARSKQGTKKVDVKFELVNAAGRTVTDEDFRGKWMLVFFGYTYCPDICPTAMNEISQLMQELGPRARNLQPVFISIDPARDTPGILAEYTAAFDPRIIGLTGSPEQIAAAAKSYNAFYKKVGETEDYTMDHTSALYLIGPHGRFATRFNHKTDPDQMLTVVKRFLKRYDRAALSSRSKNKHKRPRRH